MRRNPAEGADPHSNLNVGGVRNREGFGLFGN